MKKYIITLFFSGLLTACSFLSDPQPQGVLSEAEASDPARVENVVISAYAIFMSAEDINSSFSMWNFDVRSDDAYKGGNGTSDGDVFHQLEIEQGVLTTNWNISDMWVRLYNCLSRVNTALRLLEKTPDTYTLRSQRIGEMLFLRAYGHFLLKRLYKQIPFVIDPNMTAAEYNRLSNTEYSNDGGWQVIATDLEDALERLPEIQGDLGRPTKAAAAALLTKVYLYKAYRQDDPESHRVTEINQADITNAVKYSDPKWYTRAHLEDDMRRNFRPEPQCENGPESLWAIQYSINDGTLYGNLNWSYGLIVPNIPGVTDGGCDFYKPSQNLVNAFRTTLGGLPATDGGTYDPETDYADPRLFLTVAYPGCPYEFNPKYMVERSQAWSRSNGLYGYYVSQKHNVDPDCGYLKKGNWWASSMNRIVLRYADVMLMRAEALALQDGGNLSEAMGLVNEVRIRAGKAMNYDLQNWEQNYGMRLSVSPYTDVPGREEVLARVKTERRLELAMESERFFDLVRWGEAETVLNGYFAGEAKYCAIYSAAHFTANKNEYLPIPFSQMAASDGHYTQNIGNW